jgi:hypothetical protein
LLLFKGMNAVIRKDNAGHVTWIFMDKQVTDADLVYLKEMTSLEGLDLINSQITDCWACKSEWAESQGA